MPWCSLPPIDGVAKNIFSVGGQVWWHGLASALALHTHSYILVLLLSNPFLPRCNLSKPQHLLCWKLKKWAPSSCSSELKIKCATYGFNGIPCWNNRLKEPNPDRRDSRPPPLTSVPPDLISDVLGVQTKLFERRSIEVASVAPIVRSTSRLLRCQLRLG